jgi:hypothetical protein
MGQLAIAAHDVHCLRGYVLVSGDAGAAMRVVSGAVTRHRVAAMAAKAGAVLVGDVALVDAAAAGHDNRAAAADTLA